MDEVRQENIGSEGKVNINVEEYKKVMKKYKKINEEFLSLFEKRMIIFIEDGVDLKKDCKIFQDKEQ